MTVPNGCPMCKLLIRRKPCGVVAALAICLVTQALADEPARPKCDNSTVKYYRRCLEDPDNANIVAQIGSQRVCKEATSCFGYQSYDAPSDAFDCSPSTSDAEWAVTRCGPKIGIAPSPLPAPYQVEVVCFEYKRCVTDTSGSCVVNGVWEKIYKPAYDYWDCEPIRRVKR